MYQSYSIKIWHTYRSNEKFQRCKTTASISQYSFLNLDNLVKNHYQGNKHYSSHREIINYTA